MKFTEIVCLYFDGIQKPYWTMLTSSKPLLYIIIQHYLNMDWTLVIGKVSAIFMNPKIEFSFSKDASSEKIHITRAHLIVTEKTKFIPTYDSNIPLVCFIYNFFNRSNDNSNDFEANLILRIRSALNQNQRDWVWLDL